MELDEKRIKAIEDRLEAQEAFTKNVTVKGDLKSLVNVLPLLVLSTALGLFLGYNFYKVLKNK